MLMLGLAAGAGVVLLGSAFLWRDGRLSDHAVTLVVTGLAPASVLLYALLTGPIWLALVAAALTALGPALLYRTVHDLIQEHGEFMRRRRR